MSRVSASTGLNGAARAASNAGGHWKGTQQCRWARGAKPLREAVFAGGLLCRLSLEWSDHTSLLASRIPSRKNCFAAMRDDQIGS